MTSEIEHYVVYLAEVGVLRSPSERLLWVPGCGRYRPGLVYEHHLGIPKRLGACGDEPLGLQSLAGAEES